MSVSLPDQRQLKVDVDDSSTIADVKKQVAEVRRKTKQRAGRKQRADDRENETSRADRECKRSLIADDPPRLSALHVCYFFFLLAHDASHRSLASAVGLRAPRTARRFRHSRITQNAAHRTLRPAALKEKNEQKKKKRRNRAAEEEQKKGNRKQKQTEARQQRREGRAAAAIAFQHPPPPPSQRLPH